MHLPDLVGQIPAWSAGRPGHVRRIAVLRPNHRLGNTLLLTPLIQELETRFPDAQVELVTASREAPSLFRGFPQVSARLIFPVVRVAHPLRVLGTLRELRRQSFDLAIDPIPHSRTGRFLLEHVEARVRLGFFWFVPHRDRILTHPVNPRVAPAHFAHWPVYLLRAGYFGELGAGEALESVPVPLDLRLTEAERREGARRLAAVLSIPGSTVGTSGVAPVAPVAPVGLFTNATGEKGYPLSWWRQLIDCLRRRLPGVPLVEFIPADGRPRLSGVVPGVHTPDLRLLGATLAATSLLVLADGGVLHLADAAGAQVLGLFKTTNPSWYGPRSSRSEVMLAHETSADSVAERIRTLLDASGATRGEAAAAAGQGRVA
jgi:ADP-heptose:LPS heptosyltransferase